MFESVSRSIELVKESWSVLNQDREMLIFPLLSGVVCILIMLTFIIPLAVVGAGLQSGQSSSVLLYGGLFFFYLITYFVVIFFNTALMSCANIRLSGGDPTVSDGFSSAFSHLRQILIWALISATVGVILQILNDKQNAVGRLIISLLGTAWSLLTFFVLPILILEDKDVISALKDSAILFKRTWGETVVGQGGISLIFVIIAIIAAIPVVLVALTGIGALLIPVIGLYLILLVVLGVVAGAMQGIFTTALYLYARTGTVPAAFRQDLIENAFKPAKQQFREGNI
ncbi:MAG TPA: DUF6159 family protein [Methanospirillum sp.]|nr:DUF6159 family protein [Methanospirillum sp.]